MKGRRILKVELPTPFAMVHILVKEKDLWAKDQIIEWIFHNCGLPTQKDHERVMKNFEKAREQIRRTRNAR